MSKQIQPSRDYWTIKAMQTYGGGFVKALGNAAAQADARNIIRIAEGFPDYWAQYEKMGESLEHADAVKRTHA